MPSGRLTQKIHRHDAVCTISPPSSGPTTLPTAKTEVNMLEYLPRSAAETRSAMIANVSEISPPPPMPCKPPGHDELDHRRGQAAQAGADEEDHHRDQVEPATAEQVGQLAHQHRRDGRAEQVRRCRPRCSSSDPRGR